MGMLGWLSGSDQSDEIVADETEKKGTLSLNDVIQGHMQWLRRLEQYRAGTLVGGLSITEVADSRLSLLGKWLYDSDKKQYADTPEWSKLDKENQQLHYIASEIVKAIDNKELTQADHLLNNDVKQLSKQIRVDIAMLHKKARH